jgi:hypothetical protein
MGEEVEEGENLHRQSPSGRRAAGRRGREIEVLEMMLMDW